MNKSTSSLDKKRFEVSKYPNLAFFANYQQNNFGDKIDYGTWYSNSFWGFNPINPTWDSNPEP